jgi:hypothetical protein
MDCDGEVVDALPAHPSPVENLVQPPLPGVGFRI